MRMLLLGFMGSGKSTVGRILAASQRCPLFEMDRLVVERCRWDSIAQLVSEEGEKIFRDIERSVAESLQVEANGIISSGGGVVEFPDTMRALLVEDTVSVFLSCSFDEVLQRIGQGSERSTRPYFRSESELAVLYEKRLPLYARYAQVTVVSNGRTPQEIAREISARVGTS